MRPFAILCALFAAAACKDSPTEVDTNCTDEARPAILLTVLDSATQLAAGKDAKIVARTAAFADSTPLFLSSDGPFGLAYEKAGTYTVTVTKSGYREWTRSGVVVTADQCHVQTVQLTARLQP